MDAYSCSIFNVSSEFLEYKVLIIDMYDGILEHTLILLLGSLHLLILSSDEILWILLDSLLHVVIVVVILFLTLLLIIKYFWLLCFYAENVLA